MPVVVLPRKISSSLGEPILEYIEVYRRKTDQSALNVGTGTVLYHTNWVGSAVK